MESIELMPARVQITSILKKAILSGEYKSGQELSLVEVSSKLGVSRTPVREAFQALAADGLIELRMNKGAIVKTIDEKFVKDHYEMRNLLESEAAARAAEKGMDVQEFLNKSDDMLEHLDGISQQEYSQLNQNIHMAIWKAADNQKLYSFLMSLWNGPSFGKANSQREHFELSIKEHIKMLHFIKAGDAESAREVMQYHITRSMNNILKSLQTKD
jgi:DNA-binding GntR family transcriptional regulator